MFGKEKGKDGATLEHLTEVFKKIGAPDPEGWARSQVNEDIPQLARYLFLRQAWRSIVPEGDSAWIERRIERAEARPTAPFAGIGRALKELRSRGIADEVLTDLVRGMQADLLCSLCYLLDDPGDLEEEVADMGWALVQIDPEGLIKNPISGLHESVLETDPTGREMRPR